MDHNCIFCKIIARSIPSTIIAESDNLIVIQDIYPQAPIHYLIIPKEHVVNIATMSHEQNEKYGAAVFQMVHHLSKTIEGASEFKLKINNGKSAGQEILHLHTHFMSGQ